MVSEFANGNTEKLSRSVPSILESRIPLNQKLFEKGELIKSLYIYLMESDEFDIVILFYKNAHVIPIMIVYKTKLYMYKTFTDAQSLVGIVFRAHKGSRLE